MKQFCKADASIYLHRKEDLSTNSVFPSIVKSKNLMSLQKKIKTVTREEMRYTKTLRGIGSHMDGTR